MCAWQFGSRPPLVVIAVIALAGMLAGWPRIALSADEEDSDSPGAAAVDPRLIEVHFRDGSRLKVRLDDEKIELVTAHGKLSIPAEDVRVIDFAPRYTDEEKRQVQDWIAALTSDDPAAAKSAAAEVLLHPERTYAALQRTARDVQSPAAETAGKLLEQLLEEHPPEALAPRELDMVQTDDTKVAGRIVSAVIKLRTVQFGVLEMKLSDARSLRSLAFAEPDEEDDAPDPKGALPDPGNLKAYESQVGKVFLFKVTGGAHGSLWGTGTYTTDSNLAAAAVHSGVLKMGETGVVQVKIIPSPPSFAGSSQNGLTSSGYGPYGAAYEVSKPKGKRRGR